MRTGGFNKEKGIKALAWISYGLAVISGAALVTTFLGGWITGFVGLFPGWVAAIATAALVVGMGIDLFIDGIPNQVALYSAMLIPSLARAVPGKLGDTVGNLSAQLRDSVNGSLSTWLGVSSSLGVAIGCAVIALLMARRVIQKGAR
jgi:hypothetical protein